MTFQPDSKFMRVMQTRGFLDDCTDFTGLDHALCGGPAAAYIGFDATAQSLHVGSLVQIMMLRWLQKSGHKPIVLMGGGTTKIGDPSFRASERPLLSAERIDDNIAGLRKVFERYLRFGDGPADAVMLNNAEWLDDLNYLTFLRDIGRHFSVNRMLAFESVKARLGREQSLSFLEFNYMLLQSYDFLVLHQRFGCCLQMGGSDQWGNIVSGVDLVRRVESRSVYGLTSPLLTTSGGNKMGKTAAGAVWLSPEMLSPYDFWQFWRNTADADVAGFLKLFTEIDAGECDRLAGDNSADINEAKAVLADHVTALAHGEAAARQSRQTAQALFGRGEAGAGIPEITVTGGELAGGLPLIRALVRSGLAESGKAARRLVTGGAVKLNGECITDTAYSLSHTDLENPAILSAGKKRHASIRMER